MTAVRKFLQGNDAVSEGAIYAGCRFFAGYPITPSSEIAEFMSVRLPRCNGRFIQMEDEIAAMGAVIGASIAGKKALTATSGPGFSLKQENLGFACLTEIPVVVVNVMRGGPSTGMPTGPGQSDVMQAKWGTHGDHPIIAITPSTVYEQFTETIRAFNLSEKYRVPVIILTDEIIGHMREAITMPELGEIEIIDRKKPDCPPEEYLPYDDSKGDIPAMASFGEGYRYHITGLNYDKTGFPTNNGKIVQKCEERLLRKIANNYSDIVKVEEYMCEDADILVFAFGSSARSAKDAINTARKKGLKVGLFNPLTLWPFPDRNLSKYLRRIKKIIVPELNLGQIIYEVERVMMGTCEIAGINRVDTEPINPVQILGEIERGK
jgi:2-oxoglutarate ferredoxin oxidoreductase subunit alpha